MFSDAAQPKIFIHDFAQVSELFYGKELLKEVEGSSKTFADLLNEKDVKFDKNWTDKKIDVAKVKSLILDKQVMTNVDKIERDLDNAIGIVINEGDKKDVDLLTNTFRVKKALHRLKEMAQEASQEGAKLLNELSGIKGLQLFVKIATLNEFEMEKLMVLDLDKKQLVELEGLQMELVKLPTDLRKKGFISHDGVLGLQKVEKILGKLQARAPSPAVHKDREEDVKMREDIGHIGKAAPKTKAELKENALENLAKVGGYHSKAQKTAEPRLATKEKLIKFNNTYTDRVQEYHFIITDHIRSHPKFGTSNKDPHVYFEIIKHKEGEDGWRKVQIRYGQEEWSVLPDNVDDKEGNWEVKKFESICKDEGLGIEREGKRKYDPEPEPDQEEVDNFVKIYIMSEEWKTNTAPPPLNLDGGL